MKKVKEAVRAAEWWEYKLAPILGTFYATAFLIREPITTLWPAALMLFAALVPGAAFVSVLNDATDRTEDRIAGKRNRLEGRSAAFIGLLLTATIVPGLVIDWSWRHDALLLSIYLAAWLSFLLYSVRPFRLKRRGLAGLVADASGSSLFPTLTGVALVFRTTRHVVDREWLTAVALWAIAYGIRGILWHQLLDRDNDVRAGVETFAARHAFAAAALFGNFVVFPLELLAMALMLLRLKSAIPALLLLLHAAYVIARRHLWRVRAVVVVSRSPYRILMQEYYEVLFPVGVLLASSRSYPRDAIAIAAHLLLFPRRSLQLFEDGARLAAGYLRRAFGAPRRGEPAE